MHASNKVPQITVAFWVMKICATTLGETAGDLLSMTLNVGYAVSTLILMGIFLATVGAQLVAESYRPLLYWTVILSTSTAGTTMSDYMDRTLKLGYAEGSLILVTILLCVLTLWRLSIGSLSVNNIRSFKVEAVIGAKSWGSADFLASPPRASTIHSLHVPARRSVRSVPCRVGSSGGGVARGGGGSEAVGGGA
ncbi:MAG TPA: hypothetical protein VMI52_02100, partial [Acetobacteraceae bacterium]|nr:hypothetical protein [Acetobacteraceae bacterium]